MPRFHKEPKKFNHQDVKKPILFLPLNNTHYRITRLVWSAWAASLLLGPPVWLLLLTWGEGTPPGTANESYLYIYGIVLGVSTVVTLPVLLVFYLLVLWLTRRNWSVRWVKISTSAIGTGLIVLFLLVTMLVANAGSIQRGDFFNQPAMSWWNLWEEIYPFLIFILAYSVGIWAVVFGLSWTPEQAAHDVADQILDA